MSVRRMSFFSLSLLCLCAQTFCMDTADKKQIEANFARDVMMPLGLPIVSSYHAIRESFFLNTRVKNGTLLESLGNFFLTPSQYLFGGKVVNYDEVQVENYETRPRFHYNKMHWFKTTLSLISLPVCEVIGSTLKGLSYLSSDVRKRNRHIQKALKLPKVTSYLEYYRQFGIDQFHCDEYIPCQGHKRPANLIKRQKIEIEVLKEIAQILNDNNIIWWVDCGTCLGAYRYGGIIPWDWDIDISILLPDHENVKKLFLNLDPKKYQIQDWSSYTYPKSYLKLFVKETNNFIDIYHYQFNEAEKNIAYFFTFKDSPFPDSWKKVELKCTNPLKYEELFPLRKANFDGVAVWAPQNVVAFLQSKYGENLDPTKVWNEETKTFEKVEGHPYYDD